MSSTFLALPDLPSIEGLPDGYTECHPNGTIARSVARYSGGSTEDNHYRPDGTWFRWVLRYANGRVEDRHYHPDGTRSRKVARQVGGEIWDYHHRPDGSLAAIIRHTP